MRKVTIITTVAVAAALIAGGVFMWQDNSKSSESEEAASALGANSVVSRESATENALTFANIQTDVKNGAKLFDVRTLDEFADGHFANTENFPLQDLRVGKLPNVAKTTTIYVYCRTGVRSAEAAKILRAAGFANVVDLRGLADIEASGGELAK